MSDIRSPFGAMTWIFGAITLIIGGVGGYLIGWGTSGVDTSESGQIGYACELTDDVLQTHSEPGDWEDVELGDSALDDVASIGALLGGMTGGAAVSDEDAGDLGADMYEGLQRIDNELIQNSLDDVAEYCSNS